MGWTKWVSKVEKKKGRRRTRTQKQTHNTCTLVQVMQKLEQEKGMVSCFCHPSDSPSASSSSFGNDENCACFVLLALSFLDCAMDDSIFRCMIKRCVFLASLFSLFLHSIQCWEWHFFCNALHPSHFYMCVNWAKRKNCFEKMTICMRRTLFRSLCMQKGKQKRKPPSFPFSPSNSDCNVADDRFPHYCFCLCLESVWDTHFYRTDAVVALLLGVVWRDDDVGSCGGLLLSGEKRNKKTRKITKVLFVISSSEMCAVYNRKRNWSDSGRNSRSSCGRLSVSRLNLLKLFMISCSLLPFLMSPSSLSHSVSSSYILHKMYFYRYPHHCHRHIVVAEKTQRNQKENICFSFKLKSFRAVCLLNANFFVIYHFASSLCVAAQCSKVPKCICGAMCLCVCIDDPIKRIFYYTNVLIQMAKR